VLIRLKCGNKIIGLIEYFINWIKKYLSQLDFDKYVKIIVLIRLTFSV